LGYAAIVISACVLIFLGLIGFIFWLGGLVEKPVLEQETDTGSRLGLNALETPATINIVDGDDVRARGDQSVQAAVRGQGVALVRSPFLDDLVASGDLVTPFPKLRMPTGYRYFLLVNRKRGAVPHVAAFRDWIAAEFKRGPHRLT
jgi:DNA-binding transcriptional LysR family regulator